MADYKNTVDFIKSVYGNQEFTPLAVPVFVGNEKKYLNECIDTTFVSSVGKFVDRFEEDMAKYADVFKRQNKLSAMVDDSAVDSKLVGWRQKG